MPDVYVVLGGSNMRKSSTVRALTGVPMQYDTWMVETTTGSIDVYVQIKALQEAEITPPDFVNKIANVNQYRNKLGYSPVSNILIPLRISAVNGFPDGAVYLQHFIQVGWNIQPIFVLGATALPIGLPSGVPAHLISNSTTIPVNQIASSIRGWWNWL